MIPAKRLEGGYDLHPAEVRTFVLHSLGFSNGDGVEWVDHKFVMVQYYTSPVSELPPNHGGFVRISEDLFPLDSGDNLLPIQLLFARFVKYRESDHSTVVVPFMKKWMYGNEPSIKPKTFE